MKIVFITVSSPAVEYLIRSQREINSISPEALQLKIYYAAHGFPRDKNMRMERDITESDAVFLDLMGSPPDITETVIRGCKNCTGQIIPYGASGRDYMRLGAFTPKSTGDKKPDMAAMRKMQGMAEAVGKVIPGVMRDMRNYSLICKYFQNPTPQNISGVLLLLLREYGGHNELPNPAPPAEPSALALYTLPDMTPYHDIKDYAEICGHNPLLPNVIIMFSAHLYPNDTTACVETLKNAMSEFSNVFIFGTSAQFTEYESELRKYTGNIKNGIDLILNCSPFRLSAGPMGGDFEAGTRFLRDTDVPYMHPFFITRRTRTDWEESISGVSPTETLLSLMMPEFDGCIDTIPAGAMSEPDINNDFNVETYRLEPIAERVEHIAERAKRYLKLRKMKNADKKAALICYNYPPGEAGLFGGAFLDTFESVSAILKRLSSEGYDVQPYGADELMNVFTAGKAVNSGKYETGWDEAIYYDGYFIPGIITGNVFIGLQPSRGMYAGEDEDYHDKKTPPQDYYIKYYQWLHDVFKADAVIHVGTHGTLEFLKGKEAGMSGDCYPDRLISDLAHIYLYYCGNPSEAMTAKRRSHANLVSYQPPVFVESDLYGDWLELSADLDNYRHILSVSPAGAEDTLKTLTAKAESLNLYGDIGEIERELYRMQHSLIPKGLHIFGEPYADEEIMQYRSIIEKRADYTPPADDLRRNHEMDGLINALNARYNPARLGGDIFRNPDVLPAGYNIYQFDSRLVPSKTAMERGKRICDNTIDAYLNEYGQYPQSAAVILWGLETSRTQGETIGQILSYLGVRIAKSSSVWNTKFEIIPLDELNRPRIDVTVNMCGFFRDMFPNLIESMSDLFLEIFRLDEPYDMNYFKAHAAEHYNQLIKNGYDEDEALQLAAARIFGPPEGEYGTGLTGIISEKNWHDESQLGLSFTASLRHVYTRKLRGYRADELYKDNLRLVDVVSQLRSSNEYEITDLDHYYEFYGGLAKSVELVKGSKAAMYITDTANEAIHTETVNKSISRGIRTRVLNPKWIDALLKHKTHGAQKIAERFENVMGLAATTGGVEEWIYDDLESTYVADEEMRRRMGENNPHAYMRILEQLMEYYERGYWKATAEQLDRIRNACFELDCIIEENL